MSPKASKETVSQSFFLISLIASNLISTKIVFFVFFFLFVFFSITTSWFIKAQHSVQQRALTGVCLFSAKSLYKLASLNQKHVTL